MANHRQIGCRPHLGKIGKIDGTSRNVGFPLQKPGFRGARPTMRTLRMRLYLPPLLLLVCGGLVGAQPVPAVEPAPKRLAGVDWPRFLGPAGTSVSPETGIIAPWPKQGLRVVWKHDAGEGYSPPTVSRGRLFHFERGGN